MNPLIRWLAGVGPKLKPKEGDACNMSEGPPFANRRQLETYIDLELRLALPSGWRVVREERRRLWWRIEKTVIQQGEWPIQDYSVLVSEDLEDLTVLFGNNDIGILNLHHLISNAKVISLGQLKHFHFALSDCFRHVFQNCKPNEWGYT